MMRTRLLIILFITCAAELLYARPIIKQTSKVSTNQTQTTEEEKKPYVEDEADKRIKKSWKEKIRERFEKLDVEASEKRGFTPQIGTIETTSGIAAGGAFRSRFLEASAAVSYRGYQDYSVQFGLGAPRPGFLVKAFRWYDVVSRTALHRIYTPFFLYGDIRYRNLPKEIFYVDVPPDDFIRTGFSMKDTAVSAVTGYQWDQHARVDFRIGWVRENPGEGKENQFPDIQEFFDPVEFPETVETLDFLMISSGLVFDNRDLRGNPHSGQLIGVMISRWDDRDSNVFDFNQFSLDARQFIPLRPAHTIALRFGTVISTDDPNKRIPFYLEPNLGGSHTLRGFPRFRFRGRHALAGDIEYRWDFKKWLEIAPFFDFGKTFDRRSDWDFNDLEHNWGIGFRFKSGRSVLFRVDIGHSNETTEIRAGFSPSF